MLYIKPEVFLCVFFGFVMPVCFLESSMYAGHQWLDLQIMNVKKQLIDEFFVAVL